MSVRLSYLASAWLLALVLFAPKSAEAQAWLADRNRAQGIGIRVGNLELHPGVGAEIGYDSNVFLRDTETSYVGDPQPIGSAILRVTPHLFLSTLGPDRSSENASRNVSPAVDFRLGASLPVLYYFSTQQRGRVEANFDVAMRLLPERPVSVALNGRYNRTARPFTSGAPGLNYARNTVTASPGLEFQSRGGVLKAGISGNLAYDFFDEASIAIYNSLTYGASFTTSWEFLPKTALFYNADISYKDYETSGGGGSIRNDGSRWAFRGGLNGALSARISATLSAGYTAAFFKSGSDADDLTLSAQLRWKPSQTLGATLAYDRTLTASFQGNFHRNDRIGAKFDLLAGGAFLFALEGYMTFVSYGADTGVDATGGDPRKDTRFGADLSAEYRTTDWLAFTASAGVITNVSDYEFTFQRTGPMGTQTLFDPVNFTRFEAFLGVRVFY